MGLSVELFLTLSEDSDGASGGVADAEPNAPVLQRFFRNRLSRFAGFQLRSFDGIDLQEAIEMRSIAPLPLKVVEADFALLKIQDEGIPPLRQLHQQAARFSAIEACGTFDRVGQAEPPTSKAHRGSVAYLRLDADEMRHSEVSKKKGAFAHGALGRYILERRFGGASSLRPVPALAESCDPTIALATRWSMSNRTDFGSIGPKWGS
jgi:hypothetical protein